MPNRYLRESLKESESVNSLSFAAQVAWTHLLLTVDDWGRCEANLKVLRPKLFPLRLDQVREADLQRLISECEKAGLVRLYYSEGKAHIQMMKWEKGRATTSKFPNPPKEILECCFLKGKPGNDDIPLTDENIRKQTRTDAPDPDPDPVSDPDIDPDPDPEFKTGVKKTKPRKSKVFVVPSLEEIREEIAKRESQIDPEAFHAHYQARGWRTTSGPIRDWKACITTWEKNRNSGQFASWKPAGAGHRSEKQRREHDEHLDL